MSRLTATLYQLKERAQLAPQRIKRLVIEDAPVIAHNYLNRNQHSHGLVMLDDIFPHILSSFRIAEFNTYLDQIPNSLVYSTGTAMKYVGETRSFESVVAEYEQRFPNHKNRVFKYNKLRHLQGGLAYTMFLNQLMLFIDVIERDQLPFVFTLYTSGGFNLDDPVSDNKLRRVFGSPYFKKIIVTQNVARDYILSKGLATPDQMAFIYGVVAPTDYLAGNLPKRPRYGQDKATFDICFVANRYLPKGEDKGYDIFITAAKILARSYSDVRFHVVGRFDKDVIDISDIEHQITFYGARPTEFFPAFYSQMDVILSPNPPFRATPGAFDSFPTGCCVEAGICGAAVFCCDELGQNVALRDREDFVKIPHNASQTAEMISHYIRQYDDLVQISQHGSQTFKRVFGYESQIEPRLKVIKACLR
jgi:glycosyltransferase involved in cell wall biosynthesis